MDVPKKEVYLALAMAFMEGFGHGTAKMGILRRYCDGFIFSMALKRDNHLSFTFNHYP